MKRVTRQLILIICLLLIFFFILFVSSILGNIFNRPQVSQSPENFDECVLSPESIVEKDICTTAAGSRFVRGASLSKCVTAGCSQELCVEEENSDIATNCVLKPEVQCFQKTKCARQESGQCGWSKSDALIQCLADITLKEPVIFEPSINSKIESPVKITGVVPPGWMFEGSFPLQIVSESGQLITQSYAQESIGGSWMSGKPVEFTVSIPFNTTQKKGKIVISKDNPSGLPENDAQFEVPVEF